MIIFLDPGIEVKIHYLTIPAGCSIGDARLRSLMDKAIAANADLVRIRVNSFRSAIIAPRLVRDLKEKGIPRVELIDDGGLASHDKLKRALEIAGMDAFCSPEKANGDVSSVIVSKSEIPLDYLMINKRKIYGEELREAEIRPIYRCNQSCFFCLLHENQQAPPNEVVEQTTLDLLKDGIRALSISGGEPTLMPNLAELVAFAKSNGMRQITLNTNGVLLTKKLVDKLTAAGLNKVFMAIHSHKPEISDGLTGLSGSWVKTIEGLRNCLASPLEVIVNHVIVKRNVADLPEFARFCVNLAEECGKSFVLNITIASPLGQHRKNFVQHTPGLSELRKPLTEACKLIYNGKVMISGFFSECGPPLCAVDGPLELLGDLCEPSVKDDDFIKAAECESCSLNKYCYGLRRQYLEHFGSSDVKPFNLGE